jgi:hypothetical protein
MSSSPKTSAEGPERPKRWPKPPATGSPRKCFWTSPNAGAGWQIKPNGTKGLVAMQAGGDDHATYDWELGLSERMTFIRLESEPVLTGVLRNGPCANWKGFLRLSLVICHLREKIAFNQAPAPSRLTSSWRSPRSTPAI